MAVKNIKLMFFYWQDYKTMVTERIKGGNRYLYVGRKNVKIKRLGDYYAAICFGRWLVL